MKLRDFKNFEYDRTDPPNLDTADTIAEFVHEHPFEFTLADIGAEFGMDSEAVRAALHSTGEHLTAIPVQDGTRHLWGYADEAREEWEYLRRRTGATVSSLLALHRRMARVRERFGAPKTPAQLDVATLLLDLVLALPEDDYDEEADSCLT